MCSPVLTPAPTCRWEWTLPRTQELLSPCPRAFFFFFLASQSFSSRKFSSVPASLSSPRVSHLCSARPTPQLPPVSCPQQFLGLFCLSVRLLTGDSYLGLPWSWKTPRASPFSGHTSHRGHSPPTRAASRKTNKKKKTHSYHSPESFPR